MAGLLATRNFLSVRAPVMRVRVAGVHGSAPRAEGAAMYVTATGACGTIGGGRLEFDAIQRARNLLADGVRRDTAEVKLGPDTGQCCGGRVRLDLDLLDEALRDRILSRLDARARARPRVHILGAGHVGRALADAVQFLPLNAVLIDTRTEELARCRAGVETRLSALPEAEIATAGPGDGFVVLTHDHGLDFLLAGAALARADAGYVGMIGSASKRARFRNWCAGPGGGVSPDGLTCPIGAGVTGDKRPAVIAACVAAELAAALLPGDAGRQEAGADKDTDLEYQ